MVVGKQVKVFWGKRGGGENEKGENGFPLLIFSPNPKLSPDRRVLGKK